MAPPTRTLCPDAVRARALFFGWFFVSVIGVAGVAADVVAAYNLTWRSTNFKTVLEWQPKPVNQVYTVQISHKLGDWRGKCFSITDTECDVTDEIMKDVNQTYMARVFSIPLRTPGSTEELPFTNSREFTPYLETNISQPTIQSFKRVGKKLNVTVQDALTLVKANHTFLSLREVFGQDLSYELYYWKASSTGKKPAQTNTNEFLVDVDKEDYCFYVYAVILSRKINKRSPQSNTVCTNQKKAITGELFFIVGVVLFSIIIFIIVLALCLHKCRKRKAEAHRKDQSPLKDTV